MCIMYLQHNVLQCCNGLKNVTLSTFYFMHIVFSKSVRPDKLHRKQVT